MFICMNSYMNCSSVYSYIHTTTIGTNWQGSDRSFISSSATSTLPADAVRVQRELVASGTGSQLRSLCKDPLEDKCSGLGGEGLDDRRAEALLVKHCRQTGAV